MFQEIGNEAGLTWAAFEKHIHNNEESVQLQRAKLEQEDSHVDVDDFIFRGQSDCNWPLETSYERFIKNEIDQSLSKFKIMNYYHGLSSIVPAVNSLTAHKFEAIQVNNLDLDSLFFQFPHYNLLCFSRHLGFPSPLLDWTNSHYVAAFFAFRDAKPGQNVAIFACQISQGEGRSWSGNDPMIFDHGPYVETHHRHYRQQSIYTSCTLKELNQTSNPNYAYYICPHEDAVKANPRNQRIIKYILKSNERSYVLNKLNLMNINDFTLFGDDESLMRMLAFKERHKFQRVE